MRQDDNRATFSDARGRRDRSTPRLSNLMSANCALRTNHACVPSLWLRTTCRSAQTSLPSAQAGYDIFDQCKSVRIGPQAVTSDGSSLAKRWSDRPLCGHGDFQVNSDFNDNLDKQKSMLSWTTTQRAVERMRGDARLVIPSDEVKNPLSRFGQAPPRSTRESSQTATKPHRGHSRARPEWIINEMKAADCVAVAAAGFPTAEVVVRFPSNLKKPKYVPSTAMRAEPALIRHLFLPDPPARRKRRHWNMMRRPDSPSRKDGLHLSARRVSLL